VGDGVSLRHVDRCAGPPIIDRRRDSRVFRADCSTVLGRSGERLSRADRCCIQMIEAPPSGQHVGIRAAPPDRLAPNVVRLVCSVRRCERSETFSARRGMVRRATTREAHVGAEGAIRARVALPPSFYRISGRRNLLGSVVLSE
jgi:hypothetical protein